MKKYASVVAICMLAVMVATAAFAAAVKIDLANSGEANHPDAVGKAVLNYAKGADKTEIQINCSGLIPGNTYEVYVKCNAGWVSIGEFVAGPNGKGTFHARPDGDCSACMIAVNDQAVNATVVLGP